MDVGRIVDTALKLIDEVGIQALTLRMLADALESGTATLYRHFNGKDELLAFVADRMLGEVRVNPEELDGLSWREAVTVSAETLYDTLGRHPNALSLLAAQVPVGPNGLRARERLITLFLSHGFSVGLAARAFTAIGHYVIGFAIQQHGPGTPRPEDQVRLRDYYNSLDPAAYPATTAASHELTSVPPHEEFRFGLDLLLDGLEQVRLNLSQQAEEATGHRVT
ncbi:TetR/AcrR family transcriptional regulator C-terminal domain-containing protein [Streptomyces sp. NBC_01261]|uniref:TetR/AcrR family transcriptional regulator n=1 Tax=unclassified Streptomyces TaxID=2593676 RepID=UPI002E381769|nr:TetR/AcrR family transcriptional regulator C-terminal domain-containing protein [Streptomyces sp. NBC_01261]